MAFTILATFFDDHARSHGLDRFQIGLIIAIFAGIAIIASPIFGYHLTRLGEKFTLIAGLVTASVCCGLFSLLDLLDDSKMYFWIGLTLRSVQAVGSAAYFTAGYQILCQSWRGSRLPTALGKCFTYFSVVYVS